MKLNPFEYLTQKIMECFDNALERKFEQWFGNKDAAEVARIRQLRDPAVLPAPSGNHKDHKTPAKA